jgi:hypothetical protein
MVGELNTPRISYHSFEESVQDIQLIVLNAHILHPLKSETRYVAHIARTCNDNITSYAHASKGPRIRSFLDNVCQILKE